MANKKLSTDEISDIRWVIDTCFNYFADIYDATLLTGAILDEVVKDIEETADDKFNASDIRIAMTRVLKKRLNIE